MNTPLSSIGDFPTRESVHYKAARCRLRAILRHEGRYDWLDQHEFGNLSISLAWLATQESEEAAHLLIAFVEALASYLPPKGLQAELVRLCDDALRACERVQLNPGTFLLIRGDAQYALGLWAGSEESIQSAMEVSERGNAYTYARAVLALGRLQFSRGNYAVALDTLSRAEKLLSHYADYEQLATIRAEIAAYYLNRGELDRALTLYLEVDRLRKQGGTAESSDHTLLMLGVVYRRKKEYERATAYLQQLLERGEAQQSRSSTATAAHHLGWIFLNQGNTVLARRFCGKALALYKDIGDARGVSDAYEQLGRIALAEGGAGEALLHLQQSLDMRNQLGNHHGAASSLRHLAMAHLEMGHLVRAARAMRQSVHTYNQLRMLTRQRLTAIIRQLFYWMIRRPRWTE